METEQKLADLIYSANPLVELANNLSVEFAVTDQRQFALFHLRLLQRLEERLSQQFGASLGVLEERTATKSEQIAKSYAQSPEYRQVREDLTPDIQVSPQRFEIAFLNFISRLHAHRPDVLADFSDIFLCELAMDREHAEKT